MAREIIKPEQVFNAPNYSHAIRKSGTPVFIAGQAAIGADGRPEAQGDPTEQTRLTLRNLKAVVEACGGTMGDVVKVTVFATQLEHRAAIDAVRREFFEQGAMPASTFVVVASLADPRFLVEIEAVALIE